jgi:hypothetical protein
MIDVLSISRETEEELYDMANLQYVYVTHKAYKQLYSFLVLCRSFHKSTCENCDARTFVTP